LQYQNKFRIKKQPIPYTVGLVGNYVDTGNADAWGAMAYLNMSAAKSKMLMPGLKAQSRVRVNFRREQNKVGQGNNIYSMTLSERIISKQLRKTILIGTLGTGYSESGVPVSISGRVIYRKSAKMSLNGGYAFRTFFRKEHRGMTFSHTIDFSGHYFISNSLKYSGGISHTMESTKNGISDNSNKTAIRSDIAWSISSKSRFSAKAKYEFGDSYRYMSLYAQYRNKIHLRGNLFVGAGLTKKGSHKAQKQLDIGYTLSYRKVRFNASYRLKMWGGGATEHKLTLRVSRTFGRSFRKLW
jgi:hypothetical protein